MKTTKKKTEKKSKRTPQPARRVRIGHAHSEDGSPIKNTPIEEEEDHDDRVIDPNKP